MTNPTSPGLAAIHAEMSRQFSDAAASFRESGELAARIAAAMRSHGRVLLLGMGGSHAVNRTAEVLYRQAGLDATAVPVSEFLHAPITGFRGVVLIASQSGESGEVVRYLRSPMQGEERFGLTLNPDSTLARSVPSLLGHGGMEHAFAATRSLTISYALHGRILQELGLPQDEAVAALGSDEVDVEIAPAIELLRGKRTVVFSGRGVMQGLADAGALGLMELARIPCFALEGGQLRHGPVEALGPELGVVLIRAAGAAPELTTSMAELCVAAGTRPVVLDASGSEVIAGTVTLALPERRDIAAIFTILPVLQRMIIGVASHLVADAGSPVRSTKITRVE